MFANRIDAGRQLGAVLADRRTSPLGGRRDTRAVADDAPAGSPYPDAAPRSPVALGLPRGGVPVAAEVARVLHAPLDVVVVRKLGLPSQPEVAMGAIGEEGVRVLDDRIIELARVTEQQLAAVEAAERATLERRAALFRRVRPRVELAGREAIIVDDGIATGATARAACLIARRLGAARVVVAAPVGPEDAEESIPEADEVVCVERPSPFRAVGLHYRDFAPVEEDDVVALLSAASA